MTSTITEETPNIIGIKLKELRKLNAMTLKDLAKETNMSVGYLSQIERNISSPTINVLFTLSRALDVNISYFFDLITEDNIPQEQYIVRGHQRKKLSFAKGISDCLLNTNSINSLQVLLSTFEPGASVKDAYCHDGEECGLVLAGMLELWIDEEKFILYQNDSFSFPSTKRHRYTNPSITPTVVVWAMTPPSY